MLSSLLALALAAAPVPAPPSAPPAPTASPATIPWAVQFDLASQITGRTYRIYVAKPFAPPPKGGWPVVYVLDADATFPSLAAQMVLSSTSGGPGAVIVGVAYPHALATQTLRTRDLTPSQPSPATAATGGSGAPKPADFGGGELFHRFMMEELRPTIAQSGPVDAADQALIGYSLGGLFALEVLFKHPADYRTFVAGSPSIWWNDREVLKSEASFAALVRSGKAAPRILITSDAWEQDPAAPSLPPPGAKRDETLKSMQAARMVDNARELAARLAALPGATGYRVKYTLFPEETHLSGIPAAASRGLAFAFAP